MTAVEQVKNKLWQYKFNVQDMSEFKFVHAYDLVVEGIYRVAVRAKKLQANFDAGKIDILAVVDGKKIVFHKSPWLLKKKLLAEEADTSPLTIFIKHDRPKHTSNRSARPKARHHNGGSRARGSKK